MADYRIKWNLAWFDSVRNSQAAQDICMEQAEKVLNQCPRHLGYNADVRPGLHRCHAMVKTSDYLTRRDNLKHNTLLKAMRGQGGA